MLGFAATRFVFSQSLWNLAGILAVELSKHPPVNLQGNTEYSTGNSIVLDIAVSWKQNLLYDIETARSRDLFWILNIQKHRNKTLTHLYTLSPFSHPIWWVARHLCVIFHIHLNAFIPKYRFLLFSRPTQAKSTQCYPYQWNFLFHKTKCTLTTLFFVTSDPWVVRQFWLKEDTTNAI